MANLAVVVLIEFIPHFVEHFSHVRRLPDFHLCDRIHVRLQQLLNLLVIYLRFQLFQVGLLVGNLRKHVLDLCLDLDMHQLLDKHIRLFFVQEARVICVCHGTAICSLNL